MKYLKYFESNESFDFTDIYNILIELKEDGYDIQLFDARSFGYKLSDIDNLYLANTFKFHRWSNDTKKSFKFRVDFKQPKDYSELVDFLSMMNTEIGRFNDLGFYLQHVEVNTRSRASSYLPFNLESDKYEAHSVEFRMES